jgi:hypothetical protein
VSAAGLLVRAAGRFADPRWLQGLRAEERYERRRRRWPLVLVACVALAALLVALGVAAALAGGAS